MKYKLLIKLKRDNLLKTLISEGIVSPNMAIYLDMFEFYKEQLSSQNKRMQSLTNTAENFGYSERRTREIINLLNH